MIVVSRPRSRRRPAASARLGTAAASVALALTLAGCGGSDSRAKAEQTPPTPSPSVDLGLIAGSKLSRTGVTLGFGKTATVAFEPNEQKATGLDLTVLSVTRGSIADLSAYALDDQSRTSTPYYVRVSVRNVGRADVGRSAVPLWGLSSDNTLIGASSFTNSFARCTSGPLPSTFTSGTSTTTCLVYLVPQGATLAGVSFRPQASDDPIVWKGPIITPSPATKKKKKSAKQ